MQKINNLECRAKLILPVADRYSVDDLLNWMSLISVQCDHQPYPDERAFSFSNAWSRRVVNPSELANQNSAGQSAKNQESQSESKQKIPELRSLDVRELSAGETCSQCVGNRSKFKAYLTKRLYQAVIEKKFELWDNRDSCVLVPPDEDDIPAQAKMGTPRSLSANQRIHKPFASITTLWALKASIYQSDLVLFCKSERIFAEFLGGQTITESVEKADDFKTTEEHNALTESPKDLAGSTPDRSEIYSKCADYKKLAEAFKVSFNEDQNLKWFRTRCSDVNNYPEFEKARVKDSGKRGGPPAKFDVLIIAGYLQKKGFLNDRALRRSIEKHFEDLLPQFDDLFCPPD